ncbi:hypothetical protein CEXT_229391 [Caerostris extrusa]|uniref:Uncharacterized protein n=1 Tax=Caerostris extrusa TaxID=172846 RepID=A0AAV4XAX9_CAEEX|nr:hypothetical protein CEXT_229391 [Caerostris extrusa]
MHRYPKTLEILKYPGPRTEGNSSIRDLVIDEMSESSLLVTWEREGLMGGAGLLPMNDTGRHKGLQRSGEENSELDSFIE